MQQGCGSRRIIIDDDRNRSNLLKQDAMIVVIVIAVCPVNAIINTRVDMSGYTEMLIPVFSYENFTHRSGTGEVSGITGKSLLSRNNIGQNLMQVVQIYSDGI
jgi:hypothetical protein